MLNPISSYKALSQGKSLWILPLEPKNFWFKHINWRLRFLICSPLETNPPSRPILLSVEEGLPVRRILWLPEEKTEEDWIASCHRSWSRLDKPSLRVFLPTTAAGRVFSRLWPEKESWSFPELVHNPSRRGNPDGLSR